LDSHPKILRNYVTENGREPFREWLSALGDGKARSIVRIRINRAEKGNLGKCRSIGEGVRELVIDFGPGYRVYFGLDDDQVILLGGGDKSTQSGDIERAKDRWRDYNA